MKRSVITTSAGIVLALSTVANSVAQELNSEITFEVATVEEAKKVAPQRPLYDDDRYIVLFNDQAGVKSVNAEDSFNVFNQGTFNVNNATRLAENIGGVVVNAMPSIKGLAVTLDKSSLAKLQKDPQVKLIERDPRRYLLAESTPYGISMVQANQLSDSGTAGMTVCVTDTGYDINHEDLMSGANVSGDDNDGLGNDTGDWFFDGHGHGTHVSGTISAIGNNGVGVVGVNPSGVIGLHMVKIFNNQGNWAYGSDLVVAVSQCQTAGAKVISMSIGGGASSAAEENAFVSAMNNGVLSIAAAGNDGNSSLSYPASYDSVVSVGAVDSSGSIASFSQFNEQVEISAPGVAVNSTLPGNTYASWNGTSMATPHVAGVAALVWSLNPQCDNNQIRMVLNAAAQDAGGPGRDDYYGYGIVKAKDAHDLIASDGCDATPPPPPTPVFEDSASNLSINRGAWWHTDYNVPAGSSNLTFSISGGTGDADLYVNFGSQPTTSTYDCRPYLSGNNESCSFATPQAGTWHAGIRGYRRSTGVNFNMSYF